MNKEQIDEYVDFAKERLGIEFSDINLLIVALTHRSYVNEHRKTAPEHKERLEFLGDAVLELVTSDFLYKNYAEQEGIMTSWRAALVNTEANANAGEKLGYGPLIRLSKGEKSGSDRAHHVIMADCYEAIIGAIYLDKGYKVAEKFIYDNSLIRMDEVLESESWRDAKSYLQELAQRFDGVTPMYRVMKEEGPDHDKVFFVTLVLEGKEMGNGKGKTKKEAEQNAARMTLEKGYLD